MRDSADPRTDRIRRDPPFRPSGPTIAGVIVGLYVLYLAIGLIGSDLVVAADGREYLRMAENLLESGRFTFDGVHPVVGKPPGFPLILACYLKVVGSLTGFHALQLTFMFVAFVLVAAAGVRWTGYRGALAILFGLVVTWPLHELTRNLFSEASFLAVTSAGVYWLIEALDRHCLRCGLLSGLAFGLSTYLRPVNLFWPLAVIVLLIIVWRTRWRIALVLVAAHTLVVAPWIVRNWVQFDRLLPMVANWGPLYYLTDQDLWEIYYFQGSGVIRQSANYRRMTGDEFQFNWVPNERFRRAALENIRRDPVAYFVRAANQLLFAWTYIPGTKEAWLTSPRWFAVGRVLMIIYYLVTILGFVHARRRGPPIAWIPIGYALYTVAVLFPVCTESRYLIPVYLWLLPLFFLGGTVAIQRIAEFMAPQKRRG